MTWREGLTTAERGYGTRWQKARLTYLSKHPLCVMCEGQGRVAAATVVDHITPHKGDQALFWDKGNWQPLCKTCHDGDKKRIELGSDPKGCDVTGKPLGRADW